LAWQLARSETMLRTPGTGSIQDLEENVAAAGRRLDRQEIAAVEWRGGGPVAQWRRHPERPCRPA